MFEDQSAVVEVNRLCVPIMVCHENDNENPMTVKQKCERLRESSRAPITCLVGTMESLSEKISHLPLLQRHRSSVQISSDNTKGHLESAANEKSEKPHSIPGSNSCKSNMATEKIRGLEPIGTASKMEDIPKMVELYQCPQFGDVPVPLPYNTAYRAIITRVIQAQRHLVHKPSLKAVFHNILSSTTVEHFVINSFWWIFLENFQPDRKAQDRLFGQIAENYISILTQSLSSNSGTIFLQDFPSTLSQMLFCCFSCCFPQSCCFRDPAFLTTLCSTIYQWTGDSSLTSTDSVFSSIFSKPSGSLTAMKNRMKSPFEMCQANALYSKNKITTTNHASTCEVEKAAFQNVADPDLKVLTDQRNHTLARESHAVDGQIEVKHCVFNVWGNSPLVQHYMNTFHLQCNVGYNILVRRTQIQALPQYPHTCAIYQDAHI
ncbi:hypothetical protein AMELA_G00216540 [Ameiurus melas]|uniref:Protein FAM227A n=1 Tax=Ameiurus melas TaxID=219545 RepID=A0A7J6A3N5_AMEME|nr:hypothetical protein AMELA_G00216540 [Ameiurus melas]